MPTKKWWAALVGGVAAVIVSTLVTDGFDDEERGELSALAVALFTAYVKRNDPTRPSRVRSLRRVSR